MGGRRLTARGEVGGPTQEVYTRRLLRIVPEDVQDAGDHPDTDAGYSHRVNYYNENDRKAAAWLRELIKAKLIPNGEVDERSIREVSADDVRGFRQCHFFAGIGGWPYALSLAGWPENEEVWTGSCPCQPFSVAGKGQVDSDERHLWPAFRGLLDQCRPATAFGEQVAGKDGRIWIARVRADMEKLGYRLGAADLCAAGVGAPHIRQRLFWVAESESKGRSGVEPELTSGQCERPRPGSNSTVNGLANAKLGPPERHGLELAGEAGKTEVGTQEREWIRDDSGDGCDTQRLANAESGGLGINGSAPRETGHIEQCGESGAVEHSNHQGSQGRGLRSGGDSRKRTPWEAGFEIVRCTDGKARRFESGSFEVVDGIPSLMGIDREEGFGEIEAQIESYANAQKTRPGEALSLLWMSLVEETIRNNFGGQVSFYSPPILLSFLRELTNEGWKFSESILRASSETEERIVRSMWWKKIPTRPSHRRGLEEQQPFESSDIVRVLSSILARHIQAHWGESVFAYASDSFPLAEPFPGRVGLLRGYGNAIVPQVAAEFISAYLDIR